MPTSIWLDVDTGHDDAFALLIAAHHVELRLLGVSTVHGNAPVDKTTLNTAAVLEAVGRSDVPVVRGAARPLVREPSFAPQYHGVSGLDGVDALPPPRQYAVDSLPEGVDEIYARLVGEPPESVYIVATGPLTNIAQLLTEHPDIASRVKGVGIMGGAVGSFTDAPQHRPDGPGNWTTWAEFNIVCDPEAANIVLGHDTLSHKTTLIPLDVSHNVRATKDVQRALLLGGGPPSRLAVVFAQTVNFFADTYRRNSPGFADGPPLHDPIAVFALVAEGEVHGGERFSVHVVTDGERLGQTVLTPAASGVRVPRGIDVDAFWATVKTCLDKAQAAPGSLK